MTTFAKRLVQSRQLHAKNVLHRRHIENYLSSLLGICFPHYDSEGLMSEAALETALSRSKQHLCEMLDGLKCFGEIDSEVVCNGFYDNLPDLYEHLLLDAEAMYRGDPAARSVDEVILAYPGFLAVAIHRIAHVLQLQAVPLLPRLFSEYAHEKTGIDIHPGATIGKSFCIDHGTGIVIGETTEIADNVKLYQGVTLGALSVDKKLASTKRHPTIEHDVVIYSNATILGGDTVIGHGSIIGGNVWVTSSVPPESTVYRKSEVTVRSKHDTQ